MAERVVFDFTDEEKLSYYIQKYKSYETKKKIKIESELPINNKIKVNITAEDDSLFTCIYKYKELSNLADELTVSNKINMEYCYIKDFDIKHIKLRENIQINNIEAGYSFWDGDTNFEGAGFSSNNMNFDRAIFKGNVNFSNSVFASCKMKFWAANFNHGNLNFYEIRANNADFDFWHASLEIGELNFEGSSFYNSKVHFEDAAFEDGRVNFVESTFSTVDFRFDGTNFDNCAFDLYKAIFNNSNISFKDNVFVKTNISFWETNLGINNNFVINSASFIECGMYFDRTIIGDTELEILDTIAGFCEFKFVIFREHTNLIFEEIDELIIKGCTVEKKISIVGTPKRLSLLAMVNLGQIYINTDVRNVIKAINNQEDSSVNYTQFRMLKENYHNIGLYEEEDIIYREYMKYKTKSLPFGFKKIFNCIFGKIGKYGTSPISIIIWMVFFLSLFAGAYYIFLRAQFEPILKSIGNAFYFSGITFLTIGYGDIWPLCGWAKGLAVAEGFIGLFLMSYLTVAVVRKLLR